MNAIRLHRTRPSGLFISEGQITAQIEEGLYRLEDGRCARQALSCVITPAAGDEVLIYEGEENFVLSVLARRALDEAQLSAPGARTLSIRQARVEVNATEHAALRSARDLELTAASGTLALNARNLFTTVTESLVENVRHYVGRFAQYLLEAKGLMRMHGTQALLTAQKDIKIDAERISMG